MCRISRCDELLDAQNEADPSPGTVRGYVDPLMGDIGALLKMWKNVLHTWVHFDIILGSYLECRLGLSTSRFAPGFHLDQL